MNITNTQILNAVKAAPGITFDDLCVALGLERPPVGVNLPKGAPTQGVSQGLQTLWDAGLVRPVADDGTRGTWFPAEG